MSITGVSLILLFFILDYISKAYISKHIQYGSSISIIKGFFNIVNVHNSGVAFGFLANLPTEYRLLFLCGISTVVFVGILYLILFGKDRHPAFVLGLSMMGAGALGNLYDRVTKGYVVDFLDFYVKNYHYPAFNLADSLITLGVALIIIYKLKSRARHI